MNFPLCLANLSGRVQRHTPQISGTGKKMSNSTNNFNAVTLAMTNTMQRSTNGIKKSNPPNPKSEIVSYFVGNSFKSLPHFKQKLELFSFSFWQFGQILVILYLSAIKITCFF